MNFVHVMLVGDVRITRWSWGETIDAAVVALALVKDSLLVIVESDAVLAFLGSRGVVEDTWLFRAFGFLIRSGS